MSVFIIPLKRHDILKQIRCFCMGVSVLDFFVYFLMSVLLQKWPKGLMLGSHLLTGNVFDPNIICFTKSPGMVSFPGLSTRFHDLYS